VFPKFVIPDFIWMERDFEVAGESIFIFFLGSIIKVGGDEGGSELKHLSSKSIKSESVSSNSGIFLTIFDCPLGGFLWRKQSFFFEFFILRNLSPHLTQTPEFRSQISISSPFLTSRKFSLGPKRNGSVVPFLKVGNCTATSRASTLALISSVQNLFCTSGWMRFSSEMHR